MQSDARKLQNQHNFGFALEVEYPKNAALTGTVNPVTP